MKNTNEKTFKVQLQDEIHKLILLNKKHDRKINIDDLKCELQKVLESFLEETRNDRICQSGSEYYEYKIYSLWRWKCIMEQYWDRLTSRQLYALRYCTTLDAETSDPSERQKRIYKKLASYSNLAEFDIPDLNVFYESLDHIPLLIFYVLIEFLISFETIIKSCELSSSSRFLYSTKGQDESIIVVSAYQDNAEKFIYTVLSCPTNHELISEGSDFVKESSSELFIIEADKSHFRSQNNPMDHEILELSQKYPEDTFIAQIFSDTNYQERAQYTLEFRNGTCKNIGTEPEYFFHWVSECEVPEKEYYCDFKHHVLQYLNRLDIARKNEDGIFIDKLNNEKGNNGYESYVTIDWENDFYKWTAVKTGFFYIKVTVEKKEKRIKQSLLEVEEIKNDEYDPLDDLPF